MTGNQLPVSLLCVVMCALTAVAQENERVSCQKHVYGEVGKRTVIPCNIVGDIADIFWFSGEYTRDSHDILSSQDDGNQNDHYSLAENGSMFIENTGITDEGLYTVRVFFSSGARVNSTSTVTAYVKPQTACPLIEGCGVCTPCDQTLAQEGELTCIIKGARPKVALNWKVKESTGVEFSDSELKPLDDGEGTWSTTVRIQYEVTGCNARAVLECLAINASYLLKANEIQTTVRSDPCVATTDAVYASPAAINSKISPLGIVGIIALSGVVVLVLLIIVVAVRRTQRHKKSVRNTLQPSTPFIDFKRNALVEHLQESYQSFTYVSPKEASECVTTYEPCDCNYTNKDGIQQNGKTDLLFTAEFRNNNDRVLVVAKEDYGKQTTTDIMLDNWASSDSERDEYILIYIKMKKLERGMGLFDMVKKLYAADTLDLTVDVIKRLCQTNKCLVLLGDLEDLDPNNYDTEETSSTTLSFRDLMEGRIGQAYKPLAVWATSRKKSTMNAYFKPPYTKAAIAGIRKYRRSEESVEQGTSPEK